MSRHPRPRRSAFTLVELIVVLLIILILTGLLSSAVIKALGKIPEVETASEIAQMSLALQNFQMDFGLSSPPPSHLLLMETPPFGGDATTITFLQQMFGRTLGLSQTPNFFIDWNGDGNANGPWLLEGEQCLVFYLGGIPSPAGPQGFSSSNFNPASPNTGSKRKGPYYTFQMNRLKPIPTPSGVFFGVYIDPWVSKTSPMYVTYGGTPYAFFSTQGRINAAAAPLVGYQATDCPTLAALGCAATPYRMPTGGYMNPTGVQILSAGKNGIFGAGVWDANSGTVIANIGQSPPIPAGNPPFFQDPAGMDDQANFGKGLLGSGQ